MCGFTGYFGSLASDIEESLKRAANAIAHRGPDDEGFWLDANAGIALAHRRLSIVDLSSAGHQPMQSACGRYIIVYNGELYNHLELRKRFDQQTNWRGHSDTETLLACVARWGVEEALKQAVGMFAFALWDKQLRTLTLARDPLGEKPLYFGWLGKGLGFASELKALSCLPGFERSLCHDSLNEFVSQSAGSVPGPHTIYQNVFKLMPGTFIQFDRKQVANRQQGKLTKYWCLQRTISEGNSAGSEFKSIDQSIDATERVLGAAVQSQMLADVPVGAFLSGGIDSSLIVALMKQYANQRVNTFTVGFSEGDFNEADHAKAIAKHLGTDHNELYVDEQTTLDVIPRLASIYCEPFADSSQIPTVLISQLAAEHVTVCLSGDGGDELFGGYRRYREISEMWSKQQRIPLFAQRFGASLINRISSDRLAGLLNPAKSILPDRFASKLSASNVALLERLLAAGDDFSRAYQLHLSSTWEPGFVLNASRKASAWQDTGISDSRLAMMALDSAHYLTDDILVKVDRAAMASSLETRIPLLDRRVVELAWRIPVAHKVNGDQGKFVLRELLARHIPRELFERKKMGFGVPIAQWLRGSLKDWAGDLLSEDRLKRQNLFDFAQISRRWNEHQAGEHDWHYQLWSVLMFQAWYDTHITQSTVQAG